MMTEAELPDSGAGNVLMALLSDLDRDQILDVFLDGLCHQCQSHLESRIRNLVNNNKIRSQDAVCVWPLDNSMESFDKSFEPQTLYHPIHSSSQTDYLTPNNKRDSFFISKKKKKRDSFEHSGSQILTNDADSGDLSSIHLGFPKLLDEHSRFLEVRREKDFVHIESVNGRPTNVLEGLELHSRVFNIDEQKEIIECVYSLQRKGKNGQLRARNYSEPRKWMRGKGRVTIQFGCCYNYAVDKNGNPPGIVRDEQVDPLPSLFKQMINRMVSWHVLPPTCIPDSCIVNIYDEGDCIPPHIDHHDFVRPFCTVSLLTECNILFGSKLKSIGPGEFSGPVSIPLPVGSVLVLSGNAADIAKHCIPGVPTQRISITFRKMDNGKLPFDYFHDPELQGIRPFEYSPHVKSQIV